MDLSTLNPLQPSDGEAVSQGASRIRETRDATRNSVNVEHYLTGEHQFPVANLGGEPAAGKTNRILLNTTLGFLERDTGVNWQMLHTIVPTIAISVGPLPLGPAFAILRSLGILSPADGKVIIFGQFQAGAAVTTWQFKLQIDSVDIPVPGVLAAQSLSGQEIVILPIFSMVTGLTSGAHTITMHARSTPNPSTAVNAVLMAVVC